MINSELLDGLLIVGAGGAGREAAWLARDVYGDAIALTFAVEQQFVSSLVVEGIPVISLDDALKRAKRYIVAVGDSALRRRLAMRCRAMGLRAATLVHPSTVISHSVAIGEGSILSAGVIVTTNVRIGCHVQINVGCTLSHDVTIGDFATISPGAHLPGHIRVKEGVFIGTGASFVNGTPAQPLIIGRDATIAAGACVTKSVGDGMLVAGVPAICKKRRQRAE